MLPDELTYRILTSAPYAEEVIPVPPRREVPLSQARGFAGAGAAVRDPKETKGKNYRKTTPPNKTVCGPEGCC